MRQFKKIISWIFILLIAYQYFLSSCAQVKAPPGGDKDTISPQIVRTYPLNQSLNFKEKRIELVFDEYIKTTNLRTELLVTPSIGFYETKIKPKSVTLLLDSALKDNTTYTFNFREGIEDATERNKGINIKLVFSTSDQIDSLSLKGQVKDLLSNEEIEKALVGLYPWNDSLRIDQVKPYYFTQTDTNGYFNLENLAWGKYYLAAFTDKNANLIFNPNEEKIDFITDQYLDLDTNERYYHFQLAPSNLDSIRLGKTSVNAKNIQFDFRKPFKEYQILNLDSLNLPFQNIKNQSIVFYNNRSISGDTLDLSLKLTDSLDRDSTYSLKIYFRESIEKKEREKGSLNFIRKTNGRSKLDPNDSLELEFKIPIAKINSDSIWFYEDSTHFNVYPLEKYRTNYDKTSFTIPSELLPKKQSFWIDFKSNAFINIDQDTSSRGIMKLEYEDPDVYGIIRGRIARPNENVQYIVQLISDKKGKIEYQQIINREFNFINIVPNIYKIRVIEDKNKNGYWDQGNYLNKIKPEKVFFYEGEIKLKSYFEITDLLINN